MTDIITAMENRHAVRAYDPEKKIPKEITDMLREKIDLLNAESKLHIQLVTDEPKAFDSFMAHYGKFSGVTDYIALIGRTKYADITANSLYFWRHSLDLTAAGWQCHTLR